MHKKTALPQICFIFAIGFAFALPEAARAWKPETHLYSGDQAWQDAIDGKVTINGHEYVVRPEVVYALNHWPEYYNGGVIGPDGFPDIVFGQSAIHPVWTGEWLRHIFKSAWTAQSDSSYTTDEKSQILAFTYGYLTHAAGDLWGHSLINDFSGGVFPPFSQIPFDKAKAAMAFKHVIIEAYIGNATPGADSYKKSDNPLDCRGPAPDGQGGYTDISDDSTPGHNFNCPTNFIYRTLIDPNVPTPWDMASSKLQPAVNHKYTEARGALIGFFLQLRHGLDDLAGYSPQPLADAIAAYDDTLADLNNLDCDFENIKDLYDCPRDLLNLGFDVVIDSVESLVTFIAEEAERLALIILDAYLRAWINDIDSGLRQWGEFGLESSIGLFDPQARRDLQNEPVIGCGNGYGDDTTLLRAQCENGVGLGSVVYEHVEPFIQHHMLSMIGLPDFVGEAWEDLTPIVDKFHEILQDVEMPLNPLKEGIANLKMFLTDLINDAIQDATGLNIDALHEFLKSPSRWVCLYSAYFTFPDPIGTITIPLFKPGDRARLDALMGFTANDHVAESGMPLGCGRLKDDARFNPDFFPPIKNTITMAKLLLLDGPELNHVLSDILCRPVTTYQPGQNIMIDSLDVPENGPRPNGWAPAWLNLIDGDHAWRQDGLPRFCDDTLPGRDYPNQLTPRLTKTTAREKSRNGGSGFFPIWEDCNLRPAFRVLFDDWENGEQNFPELLDPPSGDCPCIKVGDVALECRGAAAYSLLFSLQNNLTNAIRYAALDGLPAGVVATPRVIQLDNPLGPGQVANLACRIDFTNLVAPGQISFRITASNDFFTQPCSQPQCLSLPKCCYVISEEQISPAAALNNTYAYSLAFTNLSARPVKYINLAPLRSGLTVTPGLITLNPPLSPGEGTTLSDLQFHVDFGGRGKLCCELTTYDLDFVECCHQKHCIPHLPPVQIAGPFDGAVFAELASFELSATVGPNLVPTQVNFYLNDAVVFSTTAPPFSTTLTGVTNGVYSLVAAVSDATGATFYSDAISITVTQAPSIVITNQPQDQTVVAGGSTAFFVGVTGLPPLQYQWFNDGAEMAGETNAAVLLGNLQAGDAGRYFASIANAGSVVFSTNAYLTVNVPPTLISQPFSQTNSPGGAVTFRVTTAGTAPFSYAWLFDNVPIAGAADAFLVLTDLQPAQAGDYQVVVSNVAGTATSTNATLTLRADAPRILSGPASRTVTNGSMVTFSVSAAGAAPLSYQWRFNLTNLIDGGNVSGATSSALTLLSVSDNDNGVYGVSVNNVFGTNSAAANLTVLPPFFTLSLVDFTNLWKYNQSGADLGAAWRAVGFDDSTWVSGQSLFGFDATPAEYAEPIRTPLEIAPNRITYYFRTHFSFPSSTDGVTLVSANYVDDGAVYYLNGQEIARLRVANDIDVTYQTLANMPAPEGVLVKLDFAATNLAQGDNVLAVEVHQNRTNSDDLIFGMTLAARVPEGHTPPFITQQPASLTVTQGQAAAFTAAAAGAAPLAYRWRFNALDIPGATNPAYTLTNAQTVNAGNYNLVVTNSFGAVATSNAVLVVRTPGGVVLTAEPTPGGLILRWAGGGVLQQSTSLTVWADLPAATSPYLVPYTSQKLFFRVRQ